MSTARKIEIIEAMLQESRKSLKHNSFYFLLWGCLLIPAGLAEFFIDTEPLRRLGWPVAGILGGIISGIHGRRDAKRSGTQTLSDSITGYTWGAFGFGLLLTIVYTVTNQLSPHPLILMLAGMSTFINGGASKFKPLIWGGIALAAGAILCAFVVPVVYHSLVFSAAIFLGYVLPGMQLRKIEYAEA